MTDPDEIWNRACDPYAPFTHPGDAALAAVLLCHGMAMNGGLLHAVEGLEADQRARAVAGYRLLGLDAAATAVEDIARSMAARVADAPDADDLEAEANRRYDEALAGVGRDDRAGLSCPPGRAPGGLRARGGLTDDGVSRR